MKHVAKARRASGPHPLVKKGAADKRKKTLAHPALAKVQKKSLKTAERSSHGRSVNASKSNKSVPLKKSKLSPDRGRKSSLAILKAQHATASHHSADDTLHALENIHNPAIYTQHHYDEQIARAMEYTDAFVQSESTLSPQEKRVLLHKFHGIAIGSATIETSLNPKVVEGSTHRPHTGVYQTSWDFLDHARMVAPRYSALKETLKDHPEDAAVLKIADLKADQPPSPTTSFVGQGAAFAIMAVQSYKDFIKAGGKVEDFGGKVIYQDHMLGNSGALHHRKCLQKTPDVPGKHGISHAAYEGNFFVASTPQAPVNDLHPERIPHNQATAQHVDCLFKRKFVHAYNRMVAHGASPYDLAVFQMAFLPDWIGDRQRKHHDIAFVKDLKEKGNASRMAARKTTPPQSSIGSNGLSF